MLRRSARCRQDLTRPVDRTRDEAEIRASKPRWRPRRSGDLWSSPHDIGALPGNIIQAIRKTGARNCVMMLDEIDKVGAGIQGDPGAALLEVLDPEQNNAFRIVSRRTIRSQPKMVFITTANVLDTIQGHCATAWRLSVSPATPQKKNSRSPGAIWYDGRWRPMEFSPGKSRSRTERCARSFNITPVKPGSETLNAKSARRCATLPCVLPMAKLARSK